MMPTYSNIRLKQYWADTMNRTNSERQFLLLWIRKRCFFALVLALLLAAHHPAHATDFYVDSDGGDDANPGTIELPWKTIAKVMASAGRNDVVYFQRGDTWKEQLKVPASNMIFDAYGEGAKPTIDGENTRNQAFYIVGKHDIVIRNFNIINIALCGIQFTTMDANITYNIKVINNDFTNMGSMGVRTYIPHDVQLAGFLPYGISIQGNTFTDLGNFAIGLIATDTAPNYIGENIIIRAGDGTHQTNAIQLGAKGLIVEKNTVMDTKGGPKGDGHSIILDWGVSGNTSTASEDVTVRYNFVSGANAASEQSGIHIYYGKNSKVYGNTSANNTIGYKLSNSTSTGNEFYNNVAYGNTRAAALITSTAPISTWQYNTFYGVNNNDTGMISYGAIPLELNNMFYDFERVLWFLNNPSATPSFTDLNFDADGDGIPYYNDTCMLVSDSSNRDTDGDGYGNLCDPDFDNNLVVNAGDLAYLKQKYFTPDLHADINGDGIVNGADLVIMNSFLFKPPGPSGLAP